MIINIIMKFMKEGDAVLEKRQKKWWGAKWKGNEGSFSIVTERLPDGLFEIQFKWWPYA